MKLHPFFSILVLLAAILFLSGCSEDTELEEIVEPCYKRLFSEAPIYQDLSCDPGLSFPLIVEGTTQVGTVRITPMNGAYKVSYITTGDWLIHKVSIFAGPPQTSGLATIVLPSLIRLPTLVVWKQLTIPMVLGFTNIL